MDYFKLWYLICILVFYYYASQILESKNKVVFTHKFRAATVSDIPSTTFCIDLNLRSKRCFDLPFKKNFNCSKPAYTLGCLTKDFHLLSIKEMADKLAECRLVSINQGFRTRIEKRYFYNGHYCIIIHDSKFNKGLKVVDSYLKFFENSIGVYEAKLFFGESSSKFKVPVDFSRGSFIIRCKTNNGTMKCQGLSIFLEKIIIKKLPYPFETDCRAGELSREQCFLECNQNQTRKLNLNHYRLFYEQNENVHLNISELTDDVYDEQLFPNFTICNEKCSKRDCTEYFFETKNVDVLNTQNVNFHLLNKVRILEGKPLVNTEYIVIYLLGLFGNLFNIAIIRSVDNSILSFRSKVHFVLVHKFNFTAGKATRKYDLFQKFIIYLVIMIGLMSCVTELIKLFKAFFRYDYIQSDFTENPIDNEKITLTVCMLLSNQNLKREKPLYLLKDDSNVNKNQLTKQFYSKHSLEEINNLTKNLSQIQFESFLIKGDIREKVKTKVSSLLFFYNNQKCFQFHLKFHETKIHYQLLKFTIYNLLLDTNYHTYYITPYKQIQNHKDHPFTTKSLFAYFSMKKNLKCPFSDNCIYYNHVNKLEYLRCHNRYQCVEQCVQREFILNRSVVVDNLFIDFYLYPLDLRKRIKIVFIDPKGNDSKVLDYFYNKCSRKFHQKNCRLLKYEELYLTKNKNPKLISIPLYMQKHTNRKSRAIKEINMFYESVNLIGIWFSLSIPVLAFHLFKSIFNLFKKQKLVKWSSIKFALNVIFICIFLFQLKRLVTDELLSNKFSLNANSMIVDELKLPKISICFKYDYDLDKGYDFRTKLITGLELNAITLNLSNFVESIEYLNRDSKRVKLDNKQLKEFDDLDKVDKGRFNDILIYIIYFQYLKCFELVFQYSFYFKHMPSFFTANLFKMTLTPRHPPTYLILSVFNDLNLNQKMMLSNNKTMILFFNKVTTETFDYFYYFRNPSALFSDRGLDSDDNLFYDTVRASYAEFANSSTTLIPLTQEYFHLTIDNSKFDWYYHAFYDNRAKKERIKTRIYQGFQAKKSLEDSDRTTLILRPTRYDRFLVYVNEASISELFFYLSSEFYIWLNITVIEMPFYLINALTSTKCFIIKFFSLILKFVIASFSKCSKVIRKFKAT